jgi:hypothetical protein
VRDERINLMAFLVNTHYGRASVCGKLEDFWRKDRPFSVTHFVFHFNH